MKNKIIQISFLTLFILMFALVSFAQTSAYEYVNLGDNQLKQKEYDNAIRSQTECIRLYPREKDCRITRGLVYQTRKTYDLAITDFTQAINLDSRDAFAYQMRGMAYYHLKKYDPAIMDFETALKLNPNDQNTKEVLEIAKKTKRDTEEIGKINSLITKIDSSTPQKTAAEYEALGDDLYGNKDLEGAIRAFSECVRLEPSRESCYYTRGRVHSSKKDYDAAIADFTKALNLKPDDECYYMDRAEVHTKKQNYDSAIADYTQAIKIDPKYVGAYKNRGDAYVKKGEHAKAVADYNAVLKIDPNDAEARAALNLPAQVQVKATGATDDYEEFFKLGNLHLNNKDYDSAIRSFSECIRLNPKATGCYFNRATAYNAKKNYDASIADYTQFIKLVPNETSAYINRAITYVHKKDYDAALADMEAARKIAPNDTTVKAMMAGVQKAVAKGRELQAAEKSGAEARKNLQNSEGQEQRAKYAAELAALGERLMGAGEYDSAIVTFTKCFETNPLTLDCVRNRAYAYSMKKEYDLSIADYTFLINLEPDAKLYSYRATQHSQKKAFDSALQDLTKAIEISPEDAELYKQRGGNHFYKGDYLSAFADFSKAIKINPNEASYYFMRGYIYQMTDVKDLAIADYKKALQINPNMAPAKQQLQELGVQP